MKLRSFSGWESNKMKTALVPVTPQFTRSLQVCPGTPIRLSSDMEKPSFDESSLPVVKLSFVIERIPGSPPRVTCVAESGLFNTPKNRGISASKTTPPPVDRSRLLPFSFPSTFH